MKTKELWRGIPSVSGLLASSEGRIMVSPYFAAGKNGCMRQYGGQPNEGQWDGQRYIYRIRGKTYRVARLVCEAFHGPPKPDQVCMHLDENSRNNSVSNLKWGTQKENMNAPGYIAYCKNRIGENSSVFKGRNNARISAEF